MPDPRNGERPGLAPPPDSTRPDPARARYHFIAIHRLIGAALVVLGLMAMQRVLDWGEGVGIVLAVVGLIDFFFVPLLLARLWRSRSE